MAAFKKGRQKTPGRGFGAPRFRLFFSKACGSRGDGRFGKADGYFQNSKAGKRKKVIYPFAQNEKNTQRKFRRAFPWPLNCVFVDFTLDWNLGLSKLEFFLGARFNRFFFAGCFFPNFYLTGARFFPLALVNFPPPQPIPRGFFFFFPFLFTISPVFFLLPKTFFGPGIFFNNNFVAQFQLFMGVLGGEAFF